MIKFPNVEAPANGFVMLYALTFGDKNFSALSNNLLFSVNIHNYVNFDI